jgi:hypothetical protein
MTKFLKKRAIAFFAACCLAILSRAGYSAGDSTHNQPPAAGKHSIVVYYFYGNVRCPTCHKIENYTQEIVASQFAEAIKQGLLEWKPVNTEESGNEHFDKDYELYTKSVVVAEFQNGKQIRWKNLPKIWELVGDKPAFQKYIQDEVAAYIEGK